MRAGSRFTVLGITTVATLALAGNAQAATSTDISSYDDVEFGGTGFHVGFGQVFSSEDSCSANRKVKLVAEKGGKTKLLDRGVSSSEGAISGGYLKSRVGNAKIEFVAPKTRKCESASVRVKPDAIMVEKIRPKATDTSIAPIAINGRKADGAVAGLILLSTGTSKLRGGNPDIPNCFSNRKMSLYGDGDLLDHGKTSRNGTWALHVTKKEFQSVTDLEVKVRKSKAPDGSKCGASSTSFSSTP
jgi:hypothetical protein